MYPLDFTEPKNNWLTIQEALSANFINKEVLVDITTMPRETIWTILFFLDKTKAVIHYVYYSPEKYNKEWLSRDPGNPRLLYKMSGICELGRATLLFIFNGHDYQRISNLINFYEPQKLILASQDDPKNRTVIDQCMREFDGNILIDKFELDSYNELETFKIVSDKVEQNLSSYNIVFSSLGPKISAIPLYKINRAYPETALCYVPCKEFNVNYSEGILPNAVKGKLEVPRRKHNLSLEY